MSSLSGKRLLVLGAYGSIGAAAAAALEKSGAEVLRHDRQRGDYAADASRPGELEALADKILAQGGVDGFINCLSAPLELEPLESKNWETYLKHFSVQLRAAVILTLAFTPSMKEKKSGAIIHVITSAVEESAPPGHMADYVTAKYALLGFAKASRVELERWGVSVRCIYPGFIKNEFTRQMPDKAVEIMTAKGQATTPAAVARDIARLVTEALK